MTCTSPHQHRYNSYDGSAETEFTDSFHPRYVALSPIVARSHPAQDERIVEAFKKLPTHRRRRRMRRLAKTHR